IPEGPRDSDVTDEPPGAARRVAGVTGAARGIGAATVRRLVGNGWRVVAVDRCADDPRVPYPLATRADLESLAAEHPDAVLDFVADVQDVDALREAVALAEQRFGGLDAAVAAAGVIAGGKPLWEAPATEWEALFGVCVTGVANLARAAIPALLRQEEPRSGRFDRPKRSAGHCQLGAGECLVIVDGGLVQRFAVVVVEVDVRLVRERFCPHAEQQAVGFRSDGGGQADLAQGGHDFRGRAGPGVLAAGDPVE